MKKIPIIITSLFVLNCFSQAPNISYPSGTNSFSIGTSITPLVPTNTGGAVGGTPVVTPFVGNEQHSGFADGTGSSAYFRAAGLAVDSSGNVYVADKGNNSIRKITPDGAVSTLAGNGDVGSTDGTGSSASFSEPSDVAVDTEGNVYVADSGNNKIRKIASSGVVTTLAGSGSVGSLDGTGTFSSFNYPTGVAVDSFGNLFIADVNNYKIRKITPSGVVTTFAGNGNHGFINGPAASATFNLPWDVAVDSLGNVFVADENNFAIRKINPTGVVSTLAATSYGPLSVAPDSFGNVYFADTELKIYKITSDGAVSPYGTYSTNPPNGVAVDSFGSVYLSEVNVIRKIVSTMYTITPSLPAGLNFDSTTGVISGTPTVASVSTAYTITGYNATGSSSIMVNIAVGQNNITQIPDPNFEQALIDLSYDDVIDGQVLTSNISGVTSLSISNKNISQLTGIQSFTSLRTLVCSLNNLISLDLSSLYNLQTLDCNTNQLQNLNLAGLNLLQNLNCEQNHLTSLEFNGLNSLRNLDCGVNYFSSLEFNGLNSLQILDCHGNYQLTSLNVSGLNSLQNLVCSSSPLQNLNVSGLISLKSLDCSYDPLISLDVSGLNSLIFLDCYYNQLTSLNVSGLYSLQTFFCGQNKLTSLNLSGLNSLQELDCDNNLLQNLDLSGLNSLQTLNCPFNQLTSLDVSGLNSLQYLQCSINPNLTCIQVTNVDAANQNVNYTKDSTASYSISCNGTQNQTLIPDTNFEQALINSGYDNVIDGQVLTSNISGVTSLNIDDMNITDLTGIQAFTTLQTLTCNNNNLTSLDVSGLNSLQNLDCGSNQLTSLNVGGLTALTYLGCTSNQLTSLNLNGLNSLLVLNCNYNQLTSLDLTGLNSLQGLDCSSNQMTSLNVNGLNSLVTLDCGNTPLISLNVSGSNSLQNLWCPNNQLISLNISGLPNLNTLTCNNNPSLTCIQVSNVDAANQNLNYSKDITASYSISCNGTQNQIFCSGAKVSDLIAAITGSNINIYADAASGTDLSPTTVLTTGTYYFSQTIGGVESGRTIVSVAINDTPEISISGGSNPTATSNIIPSKLDWFYNGNLIQTNLPSFQTVGSTVVGDGTSGSGLNQLSSPAESFVDNDGNIYVSDRANSRVVKWAPDATSGIVVASGLNTPIGVWLDNSNALYIVEYGGNKVTKWVNGANSGVVVAGGNGAGSGLNQFNGPHSVYGDNAGNIYVTDQGNNRVVKWASGASSGVVISSGLSNPQGIFVDNNNTVYVVEINANKVTKWLTGANNGIVVAGGNGSGAGLNQLSSPIGVFVDKFNTIYVSDWGNNRVSRWSPNDTQGTIIASNLQRPLSSNIDVNGNLLVLEELGNRVTKYLKSNINLICNSTQSGSYTATAYNSNGCSTTSNSLDFSIVSSPIADSQTFCNGATVATLVAVGSNLQWYGVPTGGIVLPSSTVLNSGNYFVSQTVGGVESARTSVAVTVNQCTLIPDINFEHALINLGYDNVIDGKVLTSNISGVTSLSISNQNISDLTGIQAFTALQTLNCSNNNNLTSLDVSGLNSLQGLDCSSNQLTSLNVSGLNTLLSLSCHDNLLQNLNVSGLNSLQYLSCSNNQLTSMNISGLNSLQTLNCDSNQLTSLDVSGLNSLQSLTLTSNKLTSLDVSALNSLKSLNCFSNQITNLNVSGLNSLQVLVCSINQLQSLNISGLNSLQELDCSNNPLQNLDVSGLSLLQELTCYNNQLQNLNVSGLNYLQYLLCSNNQLQNLNVNGLNSLQTLNCRNNQLTSLDIRGLSNLNALNCIGNSNLTCIRVDDVATANLNTNWTKDATASYSTTCSSTPTFCSGAKVSDLTATITGTNIKLYQVPTGGSALALTAALSTKTYYYTNGTVTTRTPIDVVVNPKSVSGSVSGASGIICYNTGKTLTLSNSSTGSVQWQSASSSAGPFTDITGENGNTLDTGNLTATTYYRVAVTSGVCPSVNSNPVMVSIRTQSIAGTISGGNVMVCPEINSAKLTLSGYSGSIQWQYSTDNWTFTNISPSGNNSNYNVDNITTTTYYRVLVTEGTGCISATSESVSVIVKPAVNPGSIRGTDLICYDSPATITVTGYDLGSTFQWKSSRTITGSYSNVTNNTTANSDTFISDNLTSSKYYKLLVTNDVCSSYTEPFLVSVQKAIAGTIAGGTLSGSTVCNNSTSALSLTGFAGSTIQWYSSNIRAASSFIPISEATSSSYQVSNTSAGKTYFKASVAYPGCTPKFTPLINVTVVDCSSSTAIFEKKTPNSTTDSDLFGGTAYPNPFRTTFVVDLHTSSQELIQIRVYDMLGRIIEQREIKPSEISMRKIGENYPSGIYNIILNQATEVKTLRVIKQ